MALAANGSSLPEGLTDKDEIDRYFRDQANFYFAKREIEKIDNFNGAFDFLNNEYPCQVCYEGRIFPSVSHAFQAARSDKDYQRAKISLAESIQELYELASEVEDPKGWETKRLLAMELCIRDKFRRNRELSNKLRKTGNRELFNSYGEESASNLFWGVVDGKGLNHLGNILSSVRLDIHTDKELPRWLYMTFKPQENKQLLPKINVEVYKGEDMVEVLKLRGKPLFVFGSMVNVDFKLLHKSVSRRHAAILVDQEKGPLLIDLGSKAGTKINGEICTPNFAYPLKQNSYFTIGNSSRSFMVKMDFKDVESYLEKKKKELGLDIQILKLQKDIGDDEEIIKANQGMTNFDTIFVSGLPENCGDVMVRKEFENFGPVKDIRMPVHQDTGKSKRIAFVTFKDQAHARNAVRNPEILIQGQVVSVRFAEKNKTQIVRELKDKILDKKWKRDKFKDEKRSKERDRKFSREKISKRRKSSAKKSSSESSSRSRSNSRRKRKHKTKKHRSDKRKNHKRQRSRRRTSSSTERSNSGSSSRSDSYKHRKKGRKDAERKEGKRDRKHRRSESSDRGKYRKNDRKKVTKYKKNRKHSSEDDESYRSDSIYLSQEISSRASQTKSIKSVNTIGMEAQPTKPINEEKDHEIIRERSRSKDKNKKSARRSSTPNSGTDDRNKRVGRPRSRTIEGKANKNKRTRKRSSSSKRVSSDRSKEESIKSLRKKYSSASSSRSNSSSSSSSGLSD